MEIKKQLDEINKKIDPNKTSDQNNKNQINLVKQNNAISSQSSILTDKYKIDGNNFFLTQSFVRATGKLTKCPLAIARNSVC